MKIQERLNQIIESSRSQIEIINEKIDESIRETERLRILRLELEEEAVEARVVLSFLQHHELKVWRNEDGLINASVAPEKPRS